MARPKTILGSQTPTHHLAPEYDYSKGELALEVADMVGVDLDPWQRQFLIDALGVKRILDPTIAASERRPKSEQLVDRWAATEVGIELSRQNGKSVGFEIRTITGLFVFREKLIVYTAHKGETAMSAFQRISDLIHSDPELKAEVKQVRTGNGKEHILLHSGQMVKFRTRTAGGGRGLSGDCVILDEAQDLTDDHVAALFPVMAARSVTGNPQMFYGGSAGNKKSVILGRLVKRCENRDPDLVMYRWAADDSDNPSSVDTWAKTNPALGRRISVEHVAKEYRAMSAEKFGGERLGMGDYPREEGEEWVIPRRRWDKGEDENSEPVGPVVFAIEVKWDRQGASIGVAGHRPDGKKHLEVLANELGTLWVPEEMKRLVARHEHLGVVLDPQSPASSLIGPLRDAGVDVHLLKTADITQAWGKLYDGFMAEDPVYRHTGGTILTAALAEAATRKVGDSTTWKRAGSADVSPLLSVTWAAHGLDILAKPATPPPAPRRASRGRRTARSATADLATASF